MAIPMLSGPGSLTTVVLYGHKMDSIRDYLILSGILLMILASVLFVFVFSDKIEKKVDDLIFSILTRLLGILVVAIAVQFIVEGLSEIFPL